MDDDDYKHHDTSSRSRKFSWYGKLQNLFDINLDLSHSPVLFESDLGELASGKKSGTDLFLGDYSEKDVENHLKEFNIWGKCNDLGYNMLIVELNLDDSFVHKLRLTDATLLSKAQGDNFLIDLFIRRKKFGTNDLKFLLRKKGTEEEEFQEKLGKMGFPGRDEVTKFFEENFTKEINVSVIEWICMQNPLAHFSSEKPQLPGQKHPGLRCSSDVIKMLTELARKKCTMFFLGKRRRAGEIVGLTSSVARDCLMNVPQFLHNAILYARVGHFFLNPRFQGWFAALMADLEPDMKQHGLGAISWATELGLVKDKITGKSLSWEPEEQVWPTSDYMRNYFEAKEYKDIVKRSALKGRYVINWDDASTQEKLRFATEKHDTKDLHVQQ